MAEYLKCLLAILALAGLVFAAAKGPACVSIFGAGDYDRRRNPWFAVTLAAFLAHNFWLFIAAAGVALLVAGAREPNRMAMFLVLLLAVPPIEAQITGFGLIDHFFAITYPRLLSLAVLMPAFLWLRAQPDREP